MAAIFEIVRRRVERMLPRTDGMRFLISGIPPRHRVAVAGSPHDIRIGGVGNRKARLAPSHVAVPTGFMRIDRHARAAHVPVVLHVAVKVVRNLIVHGHVVHLADGQGDTMEAAPVDRRDDHPTVVGDHEAIGIGRIDPDVVGIAAPADFVKILARIQRLMEGAVGDVDLVVAARRYRKADVVAGAANQGPLRIDGFPVLVPRRRIAKPNPDLWSASAHRCDSN